MAGGGARGSGPAVTAGATYAGAGVDIGAGDLAVEKMKGLVPGIGGFGAQFPFDTSRFTDPVLVSSTDGVGTKLTVAQATGRYGTVGIDLVAMCVDDLVCLGAEPLFMLDYIATGKVDPERIATVVEGIGDGCRQAGCVLIGGETAEHPGVMAPDDLDIAGFAVGAVDRDRMLGPERVAAGDAIIGIPSPGLRSNGYTLARHVLLERAGRSLGDPAWEGATHTVADELLRPSVIYTPAVLAVRAALVGRRRWQRRRVACMRPHHRRRHRRQPAPRPPRGLRGGARTRALGRAAHFRRDPTAGIGRRGPRWTVSSTGASAWRSWWPRTAVDAALAALTRAGSPSRVIGTVVAGPHGVVIR